jgi:L-lactate utilization protein LutB
MRKMQEQEHKTNKIDWSVLTDDSTLEKTAKALRERGIEVIIVNNSEEARKEVLKLIPEGSEVAEGASKTLIDTGISKEIEESSRYISLKKKAQSINSNEERREFRRKSSITDYMLGSVQAVTEDGRIVAASNSGSQLAPYVYGAAHLIFVIGTQKIVKNLDDALNRINEYALPIESERMMKTFGVPSAVSKILIIQKEPAPNRTKLIFVKERVGV